MQKHSQSTVVEATLRELFRRNDDKNSGQPTVLVLLFHHMKGLDKNFPELMELHKNGYQIRICPDEQLLEFHDVTKLSRITGIDDWVTWQEAERHKEQFDYFYIPVLPFSAVSDLLHFNDANPLIRILLWAMFAGKKAVANSSGADPYHPKWQVSGLHHGNTLLKQEMRKRLQQLRAYGIQLVDQPDDVMKHFQNSGKDEVKGVITAESIMQMIQSGKRFVEIRRGTIITPLAHDLIRKHHLEIREEGGG